MRKKLLFITFFLINQSLILPQWNLINPLPFENFINSSFFINNNVGWVACDYGEIYQTTNGGDDWIQQHSGTDKGLLSIYFTNEQTGYICGWDGIVIKTTNAGKNWIIKSYNPAYFLKSIFFVNDSIGWTVGYNGKIYKTINSGESWIEQISNVNSALFDSYFISENIGWIVGWNDGNSGNRVLKTTNGGINWNTVYEDYSNRFLYCISFIDSLNGFIGGDEGKILKTQNGGQSWSVIYQGDEYDSFQSIFFSDQLNGWAVGSPDNLIVHTNNAGQNWNKINSGINEPMYDFFNDVFFSSNLVGWVFNSGRAFYKTTDGGESWFNQSKDFLRVSFTSIDFLDENNGLGTGYRNIILKTQDGGLNWTTTTSNPRSLNKVKFISPTVGYTAGTKSENIPGYDIYKGLILKSTNGGIEWTENYSGGTFSDFEDIFFINNTIGWFTGYIPGIAFKTTNGGDEWILQGNQFSYNHIHSIFFIDENIGYAAGGKIYKTTNGGNEWHELSFIPPSAIISLYFITSNLGFAVGIEDLFRTTDGGDTWNTIMEPITYFNKILFINETTGYVLGTDFIFITTNQGNTWTRQHTPKHWGLRDISFINPNLGWVVGSNGFLMNTINGGTFIGYENPSPILEDFLLYQNYPNPFNPTTTIKYQIPKTSLVSIKVYDILGREVVTLVNEEKPAGNYDVEFDGSELSSGIYFYKLQTESYSSVKKMILLK